MPRGERLVDLNAEIIVDQFRESLVSAIELALDLISLIVRVAGEAEGDDEADAKAGGENVTPLRRRFPALPDESTRLLGQSGRAFRSCRDPALRFFQQRRAQQ